MTPVASVSLTAVALLIGAVSLTAARARLDSTVDAPLSPRHCTVALTFEYCVCACTTAAGKIPKARNSIVFTRVLKFPCFVMIVSCLMRSPAAPLVEKLYGDAQRREFP